MQYSVVIPLYNEADSLQPLWEELVSAMKPVGKNWEAIFVNDGSSDGSATILNTLTLSNKRINVIHFRNNQGKAAALQAGFLVAHGEIVITLDADLQDDPSEISRLIAKLDEGFDLVSGLKNNRQDPWHKIAPSYFFNMMIRHISGVPLRDINSGFKVYRKPVVKQLKIYGELYRFIPILAMSDGFKVTEILVNHRARRFGRSKYGITRFVRGLLDLFTVTFLTKFLKRPLHLFGTLGLIFLCIGFLTCAYLTYIHFVFHAQIGNRPLLLFGILLMIAGIQLISTGLIAELITYYAHRNLHNNVSDVQE